MFNFIFLVPFLLVPALAFAETSLTFNNMTLGQPPEADMICIKGPCSTEPIRPDVKSNRIDLSFYIRPVDITTYGGREISTPSYSFSRDRLARISFRVNCDYGTSQRCIDEIVEKLEQDYELVLVQDFSEKEDEVTFFQSRAFRVGNDAVVRIAYRKVNFGWEQPIMVVFESQPLMDATRREALAYSRKEKKKREEAGEKKKQTPVF